MQREYKTRCRDYIMDYLRTHPDTFFRAGDLYKTMREDGQVFNLATIYRNLDRLTENGVLLRFKSGIEDACVYQYSGEHHHCEEHLHIQCGRCGKLIHLDGPVMDQFSDAVQQQFGFSLKCDGSMLLGYCAECQTLHETDGGETM